MSNNPKIKVNNAGRQAIQELATLANKAGDGDLKTSENIIVLLQMIEVDNEYFLEKEKKDKKSHKK